MIGKNPNSKLQVKNILKYFDDMKHINVEHIPLTNNPKQKDDYSGGTFVCIHSYCASSIINEDLSKDKWCDKFCSISAIYDIHELRNVIHAFCLRLQDDEILTMNKSTSSSLLLRIHERIPQNVNQKQESSSMIEKK